MTLTLEEWTSALKLSTMWTCAAIRTKAITQCYTLMDKSCPISMVVLGKRYHVSSWLLEGYTTLCMRDNLPTVEERINLGLDTTLRIAEVRAEVHPMKNRSAGKVFEKPKAHFEAGVRKIFREELLDDEAYMEEDKLVTQPSRPLPYDRSSVLHIPSH